MEGAGEWEVVALDPEAWGAGLPGSPVIGFKDTLDRFTLFMVPVGHWSDGTAASVGEH
jgi:hypothetical protein